MARLPDFPDLTWRDGNLPVANGYDDVYFSVENGFEETKAVFLDGCSLPDAWAGRDHFVIVEFGFGTGLNLLATMELWSRHRPSSNARLHFISFEKAPLSKSQVVRALSHWEGLGEFRDALIKQWPERTKGWQRISFDQLGVDLTLAIDDIGHALPKLEAKVDAWFLDGFAPAKNEAMWGSEIYREMARLSAAGARLGTYTVAGAVRRGLAEVGFHVERVPGFGRKRQKLVGRFRGEASRQYPDPFIIRPEMTAPKTVHVIGAGIAGASMARRFAEYGCDVIVSDPAGGPARHASGNPLALLMPRLDGADTTTARLLIQSYLHARQLYKNLPTECWSALTIDQPAKDEKELERFAALLADPPLEADLLSGTAECLKHHGAMILRPKNVVHHLLDHPRICISEEQGDITGADLRIWANGMAVAKQPKFTWLPLAAKLGQVEYWDTASDRYYARASGTYAIKADGRQLFGATFEARDDLEAPVSKKAQNTNLKGLKQLDTGMWEAAEKANLSSRASLRATTPDRLPIVGPAPRYEAYLEAYSALRQGRLDDIAPPHDPRTYVVTGLGARGFTFAPWLAELAVSQAFGLPLPSSSDAIEAVSPARFLVRGLKRKQL